MKKILSLALSALLILTLLPSGALAVETFTISGPALYMIEDFEGYREMPYEDRGAWYIGYGTACDPADYPDGIDQAEAERLLLRELESREEAVNRLLLDYGISVTQNQFDALVSLTYNLGTQWINPTYRLCSYLIRGIDQYTDDEIVNAIATWCHRGTEVADQLVERRLQEAYLFLYGDYYNAGPQDYTYIHFLPSGGSVENQTVFYPVGQIYGALPEPTRDGYLFQGWIDENGLLLSGLETAEEPRTATALWEEDANKVPEIDLSTWVNPYSDLKESDWYFTVVRELSAKGVVSGYLDGTFQPESTLTAGEALKLILVAAGYPDPGNAQDAHWAAAYLSLAEELGCVAPGEITDLESPISRGLIARIAAIAMGLEPREGASPFADVDSGYTLALYEEKILTGSISGGKRWFLPDDSINRAETCAIVSRIGNWSYEEKNDPAQSRYIKYGQQYLPLLTDVPVCPYNTNLLVLDGSTMYYNDPNYTTALGIDVSSFQGDIDWEKVAGAGIEFVFIRLGGRGYSEGAIYLDAKFQQNLEGAKAAGLPVGVYFYSQAITVEEAEEEALFVLESLGSWSLEYPVVYDWEIAPSSTARTASLDSVTLTDCAITFCETVARAGYTPMIYLGSRVAYTKVDLSRLTAYDVWYAQYASTPSSMYYNYRIWQYTDSGTVPGIGTKVDMDLAFIPYC